MSESQHLAEAVESFYFNPKNGWFASLNEAVAGLTAEQAARVPAEGFNSIWAVVNHVRYWQEYMLLLLKGVSVDLKTWSNGPDWAALPSPASQADWQTALERAAAVNREMTALVGQMSEADLNAPVAPGKPARWQIIQGVIAHTSYHTCEIISIRHMQGLWLKDV